MDKKTKISLVVSFRNEEDVIDDFINETTKVLNEISNLEYEIIFINDGSNDYYLIKNAPIQSGGALQVIDGGAKYVVQSADVFKVKSDTASSCDVIVSTVDDISS